nr:putative membrane protein c3b8.06 [Quercus suber]
MALKGAAVAFVATAFFLGVLPVVVAHGDEPMEMMQTAHNSSAMGSDPTVEPEYIAPPSYFRHGQYTAWMTLHTILMLLAWVVVLPVAIMLSIARSKFSILFQLIFHVGNGLAVFGGFVYNHATPDLYTNNSHHPIGWVLTAFATVWTLLSMFVMYSERKSKQVQKSHRRSLTADAIAHYDNLQAYSDVEQARWSRDSGQGTERNSASLFSGSRQNSQESVFQKSRPASPSGEADQDELDEAEKDTLLGSNGVDRFMSRSVRRFPSPRALDTVRFIQIVAEKFLLLLGFLGITSGFVIYGGLFRQREIFSGLAHFIKGGIFFWYGLLTLGRWMGAFTEFGWAWNIRPTYPTVARWKSRVPSAEFTESFVIWLYGASNVFLEHLNNWGGEWAPSDFEHVSITILFFGGGLLGMLIESRTIREMLNTTVAVQKNKTQRAEVISSSSAHGADAGPVTTDNSPADHPETWKEPHSATSSLNPMPALVILLLGRMMSSHHQESMVSTMMHAQWGSLFFAFALARTATYVIMYLQPPTSHFPARPPTELVAAFCLTSGGLLFMLSAHDMVWAIESNGLDAMTIFTVTTGLTGVLMAWEVLVFAVKGWAVRKERKLIVS